MAMERAGKINVFNNNNNKKGKHSRPETVRQTTIPLFKTLFLNTVVNDSPT